MDNKDDYINSNIPEPRDVLEFQLDRNIRGLFRQFLTYLEDLEKDHDIAFNKLKESLPNENKLLKQANYLDEDKKQYLRKKVLDSGNDCLRQMKTNLDNFDIKY